MTIDQLALLAWRGAQDMRRHLCLPVDMDNALDALEKVKL